MTITLIFGIIIIVLLIVLIGLIVVKSKQANNPSLINQLSQQEDERINRIISSLDNKLTNNNIEVDNKLNLYNEKSMHLMQQSLRTLDQKLHQQQQIQALQSKYILERVTKLDAAQQQIIGLGDSIDSLEKTLNDKKARGTFGEIRLEVILTDVFGQHNNQIWDRQVSMSNGKTVDFLLHAPQPLGDICIDSKFPLEGYQRILDSNNEEELRKARSSFDQDVIKHINAISEKYIIDGETANQAIMFIPSETIFSEIYAYHEKLINLSYEKHVWIVSPTTLMAILNLLLVVNQQIERSNQAQEILNHLAMLETEFERYNTRWQKFNADFDKVIKDMKDISITSNKLAKRFEKVSKVDFNED